MTWLLKLLGGTVGPYLAGGVAVLLAGALVTATVQTKRLEARTGERDAARASAINPETRLAWSVEARRNARGLAACTGSLDRQNAAVTRLEAEGRRLDAAVAFAARGQRSARAVAESRSQATLTARVDAETCEAREAQLLEMARGAVR